METRSFRGSQTGILGTLGSHRFPSADMDLPSFSAVVPLPLIFPHEDTLIMG